MLRSVAIALLMFTLVLAAPSAVDRYVYISIHEPLAIKIHKNYPSYIVFEELLLGLEEKSSAQIVGKNIQFLESGTNPLPLYTTSLPSSSPDTQLTASTEEQSVSEEILKQLPPRQRARLEIAQSKHKVLDQDWKSPQLHELLKNAINEVPAQYKRQPEDVVEAPRNGLRKIVGHIEIQGGLAVTDTQHLEVRRSYEGVSLELGKVNLNDGTYEIAVEDTTGTLKAKLVDQGGRILGEDTIRLTNLPRTSPIIAGPSLKLRPVNHFGGRVVTSGSGAEGSKTKVQANGRASSASKDPAFHVSALDGALKKELSDRGEVEISELSPSSSAVMAVEGVDNSGTVFLAKASKPFAVEHLSSRVLSFMTEFISEQIKEKAIFAADGRIIYGKVSGPRVSSGNMKVVLESYPALKPIYFNEMMLPDVQQTFVGENGYFIFVDVPEGFHSLKLVKDSVFMGYVNTLVLNNMVSYVDLETSVTTDVIPVKYYDAFGGFPIDGDLSIQGVSTLVTTSQGAALVTVNPISRLGLVRAKPIDNEYLDATYLYSDSDEYLHLPAISKSWIDSIRPQLKVSDSPYSGVIVGFVPYRNYEVYLAGERASVEKIAYFDSEGKILSEQQGVSGGGFILFDIPEGVAEVVVVPEGEERLSSSVVPVDDNSLSILLVK